MIHAPRPLAVYIHWPFCKAKCPYCDFNSHVRDRVDFSAWKVALVKELEYMKGLASDSFVTSIFFGGGTPSLMQPEIAEAAIKKVRELWPCDDNIEITLEANPTSVEADTFPAFKQAGANRLSIGVQSLRPDALKFLGREHSADEALKALELARKYFERYSFDLIYALPGQTLEMWETQLSEALLLTRGHMSLYQLTIEENTAFHTAYAKGAFTLPDEETAARMYELTERLTGAYGMSAYEVSNYAAPGQESRHNMAYWLGHDYIGVGPGAHGRITGENNQRFATLNLKSPERWLSGASENGHGLESNTPLTSQVVAEERLMMGLRLTNGLPLAEVRDFIDKDKRLLAIREGLLQDNDARLIATPKGRLVLTALTALLLASQDQ